MLQRGHEELLLADGFQCRPLYVKEGGRYIKEFLRAAGELGTSKRILAVYPHEAGLLDLLLDYGILAPQGTAGPGKRSENPSGKPAFGKRQNTALYLLLSQSCNMGCIYCLDGQATYQTDKHLRMDKETAFRSIERCLDETVEGGRLEVIFFGGEPLLNWPLAKEIITHCEKCLKERHPRKQRHYHFTTNLSFLPDDLIEWARRFGISFLVDIDGPPAIHNRCRPFKGGGGSYEAVAANIRQLRAAGLKVDLRATITALNQDHLLDIAEQHKALGGSSCAFVPVMPVNSDESILPEELLPAPERIIDGMAQVYRSGLWKHEELFPFNQYASRFGPGPVTVVGCGAPYGNTPVVDAKGDVYPCIYLVGISRFHAGNMMDGSYPKKDLLERMYEAVHVERMEDCKACAWRYLCCGSCPVGRLTVMDNPSASPAVKEYCRKIRCDYTKGILEILLWEKATEAASECPDSPVHASTCV